MITVSQTKHRKAEQLIQSNFHNMYELAITNCNGVAKLPRPSRSAQTCFTTSTRLHGFILLRTKR